MNRLRFFAPLALCALLAAPVFAQDRDATLPRVSPNASAGFTIGVTDISVQYGAPSVRERTIFGDLVPYDEVWRTGANEATAITFSTDVFVEGQALDAGTYGLFTVPGQTSWTIIFNEAPEQWGAYQYDEAKDVLRVQVTPQQASERETMAFSFDNLALAADRDAVDLVLHWADVRVPVTIATETDRHVEHFGDAAAAQDDWRRPFAYARYALQTGRHMDKALEWADAALLREESYQTLAMHARLQAAGGDHAGAVETGEMALSMAAAMTQPPRDLDAFQSELASWRAHD